MDYIFFNGSKEREIFPDRERSAGSDTGYVQVQWVIWWEHVRKILEKIVKRTTSQRALNMS